MKNRLLTFTVFSILAFTSLFGCGGGTSGTGVYSSDIDTTRSLSTLGPDDFQKICNRYETFANFLVSSDQVCTFAGIILANADENNLPPDRTMECQRIQNQCIDDSKASGSSNAEISCPVSLDQRLSECNGTVGELDQCINEQFGLIENFFNALSCKDAETPSSVQLPRISDATSCVALQNKCPGIFR